MSPDSHGCVYAFEDFEIDCRAHEVRKGGVSLHVQQLPFKVLAMLLGARGKVVTRDELRNAIWDRDTHVDFDRGINKAVNCLRQLLHDKAAHPRFIETRPKAGYRFLAPVTRRPSRAVPFEIREALLKARHFGNRRTAQDLTRSVGHFRRALERDPEYAPTWAGLAEAYVLVGLFGLQQPGDVFPAAQQAAERALALDPAVVEAHTALADVWKFYEWNWDKAERAYRQAIAIDAGYAVAHHWYEQLLAMLKRHDEALKEIEAARRCDPVSVPVNAFLSYVWFEARQFERAVEAAQEALELDANAPLTHFLLGRAYAKAGDIHNSVAALETAVRLGGQMPIFESNLGFAYARAGLRGKAERILRQFTHGPRRSPIDIALVSHGLGDAAMALTALEDAQRTRSPRMLVIGDPFFSELAAEPRYQRLLADLQLPR